jgi:hypothetical protein
MAFYDDSKQIVIGRNVGIDSWVIVKPNGAHSRIDYHTSIKAMDVAKAVAKMFPDKEVGVSSDCFGPVTRHIYGPIVWLKPGFETMKGND